MKLLKKLPVTVNEQDGKWEIKGEGFFATCSEDPQLEGVLELVAQYQGEVKTSVSEDEGVAAVISKLEKYQSGKMSGKEAQKMVNKLKELPNSEDLISKMINNQKLEESDIAQLEGMKSSTVYEMDYNLLSLVDKELVATIELSVIFPGEEFQAELKAQFDEERAQDRRAKIAVVAQIMGSAPKQKQKSVVEYLREKQAQILENKPATYSLDLLSPFPQANDLERVLILGQDIASSSKESMDLEMLENDLNKRDVAYYSSALSFLGLVFVDNRSLCLTRAGDSFFQESKEVQKVIVRETLCQDDLVAKILSSEVYDEDEMTKEFAIRGLGEETMKRRVSCLKSWKKYLDS